MAGRERDSQLFTTRMRHPIVTFELLLVGFTSGLHCDQLRRVRVTVHRAGAALARAVLRLWRLGLRIHA